jgi:hypothetical protein
MLRLLLDITTNRLALRGTNRKRAVPFLPSKRTHANFIMHPTRRNRLQLAKHISEAVCRAKANQQMDVIGNTTNTLGNAIRGANNSTKVGV